MSEHLTVSFLQLDIHWEDPEQNRSLITETLSSMKIKPSVVLLPETFTTGFSMKPSLAEDMHGQTLKWLEETARKFNIILGGSIIIKEANEAITKFVNRFLWMLPNGQYGFYDKRHLFSFGNEGNDFTAGDKRLITSVNGWKFAINICYDLRFPVWSRQQQPGEYDVLVNVANWPSSRIQAWTCLLQARAIENQCYTIGVNRVGVDGNNIHYNGTSIVVDPLGAVLYNAGEETGIHTITLSRTLLHESRKQFPFAQDADVFFIQSN